jgi:hypothetical protein
MWPTCWPNRLAQNRSAGNLTESLRWTQPLAKS